MIVEEEAAARVTIDPSVKNIFNYLESSIEEL